MRIGFKLIAIQSFGKIYRHVSIGKLEVRESYLGVKHHVAIWKCRYRASPFKQRGTCVQASGY